MKMWAQRLLAATASFALCFTAIAIDQDANGHHNEEFATITSAIIAAGFFLFFPKLKKILDVYTSPMHRGGHIALFLALGWMVVMIAFFFITAPLSYSWGARDLNFAWRLTMIPPVVGLLGYAIYRRRIG
jgi:hypothetical protein